MSAGLFGMAATLAACHLGVGLELREPHRADSAKAAPTPAAAISAPTTAVAGMPAAAIAAPTTLASATAAADTTAPAGAVDDPPAGDPAAPTAPAADPADADRAKPAAPAPAPAPAEAVSSEGAPTEADLAESVTADVATAEPVVAARDTATGESAEVSRTPQTMPPVADPLPPPPAAVPKSSLRTGSWRGRGWFQIGLDLTIPVAGVRPGRGSVRSAAGGVGGGWRAQPWLGLGVAVTTFFHDSETRVISNDLSGLEEEASDFGRMTLFDLPQVRLFAPVAGRIEPWLEVAATMGAYHEPWGSARWVAGGRGGAGVAFWLGPAFSLDLSAAARMLVVDKARGWTVQTGFGATLHW